jgi:ppGpp synthetase/RelA/SpoT-type nucleotidyltranferase
LKDYVNTNLNLVKKELNSLVEKIDDKTTQIKVRQITEIISDIPKTRNVTDEDILNLFNYYQLVEEITKITKND